MSAGATEKRVRAAILARRELAASVVEGDGVEALSDEAAEAGEILLREVVETYGLDHGGLMSAGNERVERAFMPVAKEFLDRGITPRPILLGIWIDGVMTGLQLATNGEANDG